MKKQVTRSQVENLLNKADKLKKKELKRTVLVPGPGNGDRLAQGAPSAVFRMPSVSDLKWDMAFMSDKDFVKKYGYTKEQAEED